MSERIAEFPVVKEFYVDSPYNHPDTITVSLVVEDAAGVSGVIKFTFDGDVCYPRSNGNNEYVPQAEDFLDEFAANLGYRLDKLAP